MGVNTPPYGPGRESPANGHDDLYGPTNYRDYIFTKRPTNARAKRAVALLSLDVVALFIVLGILKNLSDIKEVIALFVGIFYLTGRAVIIWIKFLNFYGKNEGGIRKGWKSFKEMFKE
jgi:hypothetical protein